MSEYEMTNPNRYYKPKVVEGSMWVTRRDDNSMHLLSASLAHEKLMIGMQWLNCTSLARKNVTKAGFT